MKLRRCLRPTLDSVSMFPGIVWVEVTITSDPIAFLYLSKAHSFTFPIALAVLTGLDFVQNIDTLSSKNILVHTYGEPRLGNDIFAEYVDNVLVRTLERIFT